MKKLFLLGLLMIMSVCYIFGQGEALDAKKGFYIYLKGSKTAITENEYLNYAKVMEYNVYKFIFTLSIQIADFVNFISDFPFF